MRATGSQSVGTRSGFEGALILRASIAAGEVGYGQMIVSETALEHETSHVVSSHPGNRLQNCVLCARRVVDMARPRAAHSRRSGGDACFVNDVADNRTTRRGTVHLMVGTHRTGPASARLQRVTIEALAHVSTEHANRNHSGPISLQVRASICQSR